MVLRFVLSAFLLALFELAPTQAKADDAPTQWVGRVSVVDGNLSLRTAKGDWADSAVVNDPIAAGMSVRTAAKAKAVLRIGPETIALAPETELTFGQLDSSGTQLTVRHGRVGIQLASSEPDHSIEVDTPRGGVWMLTPGTYDITAGDTRDDTKIAVLDGRTRIVGKGLDRVVATGSQLVLGGAEPVSITLEGIGRDEFVASWRVASEAENEPAPLAYVSPEMTGYEALEANGSWSTIDGYGAVWFPKDLAADWTPYRDGHWRWVAPWGWTWIDDMDWGFAPSHYGRWVHFGLDDGKPDGWGWVPGAVTGHPVYMPAAVAFLGTAGVGISYPDAFGPAVAWFPLAPDEPYWPAYTKDIAEIRALNAGSGAELAKLTEPEDGDLPEVVLRGEYRNRRFASAVPRTVFLDGKPVAASLVQLPERRLKDAPLLGGSPQLAPAPPATTVAAVAKGRAAGVVKVVARVPSPRSSLAAAKVSSLVRVTGRGRSAVATKQQPHRGLAVRQVKSAPPPRAVIAVNHGAKPHFRMATSSHRRR